MPDQKQSELEAVIADVAASYREGRLIDSLSSAQLPNKRQVIEALGHLKAVMYLGYYATGALDDASLVPLVQRYVTVELILLLIIPLAASLAARGIAVSHDTVWRFLRRQGRSFKKNRIRQ